MGGNEKCGHLSGMLQVRGLMKIQSRGKNATWKRVLLGADRSRDYKGSNQDVMLEKEGYPLGRKPRPSLARAVRRETCMHALFCGSVQTHVPSQLGEDVAVEKGAENHARRLPVPAILLLGAERA